MIELNKIYQGDSLEVLKSFPENSIDCCVTSPPYFGLRDYGTAEWVGGDPNCDHIFLTKGDVDIRFPNRIISSHALRYNRHVCKKCGAVRLDSQIGLESSPEEFVKRLTEVFAEVRRVLKPEGTLWLNIGDSYNGYKGNATCTNFESMYAGHRHQPARKPHYGLEDKSIKEKDLIGIPWMLAFSLRAAGWYLRQDIIWSKPNPMPESVTDRCTKSHEYIFLLSKSKRYYFDNEAVKEPAVGFDKSNPGIKKGNTKSFRGGNAYTHNRSFNNSADISRETHGNTENLTGLRNRRSVWSIAPSKSQYAHFATFPEKLVQPCILAGCPEGGIVLDPFMGTGTTGLVARKLHRNYVGIELNPTYQKIAEQRIANEGETLFNQNGGGNVWIEIVALVIIGIRHRDIAQSPEWSAKKVTLPADAMLNSNPAGYVTRRAQKAPGIIGSQTRNLNQTLTN